MRPYVQFFQNLRPCLPFHNGNSSFTFSVYTNHVKQRWFHLCKKQNHHWDVNSSCSSHSDAHPLTHKGLIIMTNDHPPTSHPAPCPHCPAFWQHVGSIAANLQLGSQFHPEPKMPSSGNKLKSQLGTEKCKWAENLGYTDVSWEPSKGKPISPSEHHGTLCRYLKSRHNTQLNYPGDPKDLTMQPETQIKVHLLNPSRYCSVLLEQSSNSGCIVLGDSGESPKNKVWKSNYKEKKLSWNYLFRRKKWT